jgi:hypothetical protein
MSNARQFGVFGKWSPTAKAVVLILITLLRSSLMLGASEGLFSLLSSPQRVAEYSVKENKKRRIVFLRH